MTYYETKQHENGHYYFAMADKFPNGFTSWAETHFEIVRFISDYDEDQGGVIGLTGVIEGIGGLYELAQEWTDQFEELNKDRDDWDGEWFDRLELFCNQKNNSNNNI